MLAEITVSRLLKSCATPAATRPIASSFSACCNRAASAAARACASWTAVTSRPSGMICTTCPRASRTGISEKSIARRLPVPSMWVASKRTNSPSAARANDSRRRALLGGVVRPPGRLPQRPAQNRRQVGVDHLQRRAVRRQQRAVALDEADQLKGLVEEGAEPFLADGQVLGPLLNLLFQHHARLPQRAHVAQDQRAAQPTARAVAQRRPARVVPAAAKAAGRRHLLLPRLVAADERDQAGPRLQHVQRGSADAAGRVPVQQRRRHGVGVDDATGPIDHQNGVRQMLEHRLARDGHQIEEPAARKRPRRHERADRERDVTDVPLPLQPKVQRQPPKPEEDRERDRDRHARGLRPEWRSLLDQQPDQQPDRRQRDREHRRQIGDVPGREVVQQCAVRRLQRRARAQGGSPRQRRERRSPGSGPPGPRR